MKNIKEFLRESNAIEDVIGPEPLEDAMEAWAYIEMKKQIKIEDILEVHRLLMKRLRPDIAGRFRDCNVRVGGHIPPDWTLVSGLLYDLLPSINNVHKVPSDNTKASVINIIHTWFEEIHPFEDGNGRVGRIIWQWQRMINGLPVEIIYASKRQEYYKLFHA
jgi:Fic family protein